MILFGLATAAWLGLILWGLSKVLF